MESQLSDQTAQTNTVDASAYKEITKNFAIKAWEADNTGNPTTALPQVASITPTVSTTVPTGNIQDTIASPTIQTFSARTIPVPTFSLGGVIKKLLVFVFSALPLILLLVSLVSFLIDISFDITQIGQYPTWTTSKLEYFVKNTIIPLTK